MVLRDQHSRIPKGGTGTGILSRDEVPVSIVALCVLGSGYCWSNAYDSDVVFRSGIKYKYPLVSGFVQTLAFFPVRNAVGDSSSCGIRRSPIVLMLDLRWILC